ncbi:hypothetical protein [Stygiolobus sp. CP8521M]|uniref:hypothetical protein n=1 Tax=Stygiolobus sp. CP8521M TaxID=3133136 RepID=UPI00307F471D
MGIDKTQWENNAKSAGLSVDQKDAEILYVPSALEAQDINILSQIGIIAQGLRSKLTVSSEISDKGVNVFIDRDERNENFIKSLTFSSLNADKSQILHDNYLRWLSLKVRLDKVIWAYQIKAEISTKTKELIKVPSMLPLIGNVMLTGVIITNTKNFNINQRKFCIV